MPDEREAKIQRVLSIVRLANVERYGVDAVDEAYVRSLPDWRLDRIIDPKPESL